jgi:hypothetical protein
MMVFFLLINLLMNRYLIMTCLAEAPARTHAHARALCRSASHPPLSCTCLACESVRPAFEHATGASTLGLPERRGTDLSRVLSPNKRMSEWRVKKLVCPSRRSSVTSSEILKIELIISAKKSQSAVTLKGVHNSSQAGCCDRLGTREVSGMPSPAPSRRPARATLIRGAPARRNTARALYLANATACQHQVYPETRRFARCPARPASPK